MISWLIVHIVDAAIVLAVTMGAGFILGVAHVIRERRTYLGPKP